MEQKELEYLRQVEDHASRTGWVSPLTREDKEYFAYLRQVSKRYEVIHDRVNIRDIKPMTDSEYCVRGCTALLDAIGDAIHHIGNVHKYAREEDVPAHTLFVITTDGMENASRLYDSARVKQMIEHEKSKYGWEFLFLGANIDAVETAKHFGISEDRAVNYHSDSVGTRLNYEVVSCAITSMRSGAPMSADWKAPIEADYKTRKGEKN